MQPFNTDTLPDWITASARSLLLPGMLAILMLRDPIDWIPPVILFISALAASLSTVLGVLSQRTRLFRFVSIGIDWVAALSLFYLSGNIDSNLLWSGVLPLITASVYFPVQGVLVVTLINGLAQAGLALAVGQAPTTVSIFVAASVVLSLAIGLLISLGSNRLGAANKPGIKAPVGHRRNGEKSERERRRAIFNLISALSATLNYQRVLDTSLDLSASALSTTTTGSDQLVSAVLLFTNGDGKGTELEIGPARRLTANDMRITLPGTSGLIGKAIDEGHPCLSKEVGKDPELVRVVSFRPCQVAYCIPLRTGVETYGVLLFAHPDINFFTEDNREVLDIVGNQAVIALQNAQLYHALEVEKERMMDIQEEARKKMARDLHDGPTQSVAAIAMRVNFARRLIERDIKAAAEELFKIEELARRTTKEIRHLLFTLRPLVLESQGLVPALESMAEKLRETYNQNVIIQADPRLAGQLEVSKQAVIFYIAEEAVNNARKHAKASHIWVRLKPLKDGLSLLEIEDDGVGFNQEVIDSSYDHRGSLGMVNMRERTELVNGILHIQSSPGRGTHIQVVIPLTEEAVERIRRGL